MKSVYILVSGIPVGSAVEGHVRAGQIVWALTRTFFFDMRTHGTGMQMKLEMTSKRPMLIFCIFFSLRGKRLGAKRYRLHETTQPSGLVV